LETRCSSETDKNVYSLQRYLGTRQPKYLCRGRIENFVVIVLSLTLEVLCKRDVRCRDRDDTETLESRDRDEAETLD